MIAVQTINNKKQKAPAGNAPVVILHIIKSLGRGGAEMLLPETLHNHDKEKYQFHYIYFLPWKDQMVEQIRSEGGTVTCLSARNNLEILSKISQIADYVKKHNVRIIHCHMPWAGVLGRIVGKLKGVPVVYTEHNLWERYHKLTGWLNKLSYRFQHTVIAVSGDVEKSIRLNYRKTRPEVHVVLNGVNTEKFSVSYPVEKNIRRELNIADQITVIGIVCVFRAQKRLDAWLDIAASIHAKHPDTAFIIVGDGILKNEIFEKARMLKMDGYLYFAGMQSEIRPYLKAMNIFMMSSEFEGLPIALLEAMSMGCMPACTAAGGIRELIVDKVNGLVVPADQPMLLADRLIQFLQNPVEIAGLGMAARKTVINHFSIQKMVSEVEFIYEEVINQEN